MSTFSSPYCWSPFLHVRSSPITAILRSVRSNWCTDDAICPEPEDNWVWTVCDRQLPCWSKTLHEHCSPKGIVRVVRPQLGKWKQYCSINLFITILETYNTEQCLSNILFRENLINIKVIICDLFIYSTDIRIMIGYDNKQLSLYLIFPYIGLFQ